MYSHAELTPDLRPGRHCIFCWQPLQPTDNDLTCVGYCTYQENAWLRQIRGTPAPHNRDPRTRGRGWLSG